MSVQFEPTEFLEAVMISVVLPREAGVGGVSAGARVAVVRGIVEVRGVCACLYVFVA